MGNMYRMYTGDDGLTHSEMMNVHPVPSKTRGGYEKPPPQLKAVSVRFLALAPGYDDSWHTISSPVLSITLSGEVEFGMGDGTVLRHGPGDVMFFEKDMTGKGHTARVPGNQPRLYMGVFLEPGQIPPR